MGLCFAWLHERGWAVTFAWNAKGVTMIVQVPEIEYADDTPYVHAETPAHAAALVVLAAHEALDA